MWAENILTLPATFWEAYRSSLTKRDQLAVCEQGTMVRSVHGGQSDGETLTHFVSRFPNSASRICYLVLNPRGETTSITDDIYTSFMGEEIHILDLVGGAGAATVGLLTTLCHLRHNKRLPILPLNVVIHAADISETALEIYGELLDELASHLIAAGISVRFHPKVWDARDVAQTSQLCDEWLNRAGKHEVYVIVSNISGGGKTCLDEFERSFLHVTERIANRNATLLWIEHKGRSAIEFLKRAIARILAGHWFTKKTDILGAIEYEFRHEIQIAKNIIPSGFVVLGYHRREA